MWVYHAAASEPLRGGKIRDCFFVRAAGVWALVMIRTVTLSLAVFLASGANGFVGSGLASPSLKLACRTTPFDRQSRRMFPAARVPTKRRYRANSDDCECSRANDKKENQSPDQGNGAARTTTTAASASAALVSLAKRAVATLALASFLASAVSVGEVAFPPPTPGTGTSTGGGTSFFVAPAYAELEPLPLKSYSEEFSSALAPVNTVRGLWRTRETRSDGSALPQEGGRLGKKGICGGRLSFKGFVGAGKGTVEYKGCGDREGKGRWLTKPKNIVNGRITLSARWSVNFADGTSLLYRGDVVQDAEAKGTALRVDAGGAAAMGGPAFERPDAHIRGEVLRPVKSIQGTLTEKKIGEFEADLIELPSDEDKL